VDRILDMMRTAINVTGDLTASVAMNRIIGGKLTAKEELERQTKLDIERKKFGHDVIIRHPNAI
jgi:Na+/H+-dicarboxylate symporter